MAENDAQPSFKMWNFSVKHCRETHVSMFITGDCDSLGNWQPENIIPLVFDEKSETWTVDLNIPADRDVQYRYCLCIEDCSSAPRKTMILQWETNLLPRLVKKRQELREHDSQVDMFGMFDGHQKLENGWLTHDMVVELRLHSESIQWISENGTSDKKINVKLKRSWRNQFNDNSTEKPYSKNTANILISMSNENGKFRCQDDNGYSYSDVEAAVFMIRTFSLEQQCFVFEFIDNTDSENIKMYFAYLVLENKFYGSDGTVRIPIHSGKQEYLGSLSVEYLIIRPLPNVGCSFRVSYAKYWNNSWTGLEIGHRGAGVSFSSSVEKNAKWRENTIGSFKSAAQSGAHLIEFDVQLTNDRVPIIYHDFHVLLDVQNKTEERKRQILFPFHKLNCDELKDFQIRHLNEINGSFSFENDDQEDYSPFPSLEQVLHAVDSQIGFNIEIKYTSTLLDGSKECEYPIDMNEYVDKILQVVYANAGRRYIVFSSFNPDICAMTRWKQNKYPVMFLTQGVTTRYPPYLDQRMKNIENAIHFANSLDLLGIVAHSENLLNDNKLVKLILNNNLVLFCWGEDNNDNNNIAKLKELGVHGIIFDRIDKLGEKSKKDLFSLKYVTFL